MSLAALSSPSFRQMIRTLYVSVLVLHVQSKFTVAAPVFV